MTVTVRVHHSDQANPEVVNNVDIILLQASLLPAGNHIPNEPMAASTFKENELALRFFIAVSKRIQLNSVRELIEEAGIQSSAGRNLGEWRAIETGHTWAFHECHVAQDLPDTWVHFAEDDGGHEFRFFWHPLMSEPSERWHQVFKDALGFLRATLADEDFQRSRMEN